MTVNHDVVGSSPTGGVVKRSKERFFVFLALFFCIFQSFFHLFLLLFFVLSLFSLNFLLYRNIYLFILPF